jgi:hypothetical protein
MQFEWEPAPFLIPPFNRGGSIHHRRKENDISPKSQITNSDDMLPEYDFSNAVRGKPEL